MKIKLIDLPVMDNRISKVSAQSATRKDLWAFQEEVDKDLATKEALQMLDEKL